jgi:hypothetical protein
MMLWKILPHTETCMDAHKYLLEFTLQNRCHDSFLYKDIIIGHSLTVVILLMAQKSLLQSNYLYHVTITFASKSVQL